MRSTFAPNEFCVFSFINHSGIEMAFNIEHISIRLRGILARSAQLATTTVIQSRGVPSMNKNSFGSLYRRGERQGVRARGAGGGTRPVPAANPRRAGGRQLCACAGRRRVASYLPPHTVVFH
ncbi:unnamed protein product, partial [Brenthis ino]